MELIIKDTINFIREYYEKPMETISLHEPVFNGNEKKYLEECIDTTYVSSVGKFVDLFEEMMVDITTINHNNYTVNCC